MNERHENDQPDAPGHFGDFGGQYVPETLMPALIELEQAYEDARGDAGFLADLDGLLKDYVGRPSPLTHAARLSAEVGAKVYLKREAAEATARQVREQWEDLRLHHPTLFPERLEAEVVEVQLMVVACGSPRSTRSPFMSKKWFSDGSPVSENRCNTS